MPAGTAPAAIDPTSKTSHSGRLKPRIVVGVPGSTPRATRARPTLRTNAPYSAHEVGCQPAAVRTW